MAKDGVLKVPAYHFTWSSRFYLTFACNGSNRLRCRWRKIVELWGTLKEKAWVALEMKYTEGINELA